MSRNSEILKFSLYPPDRFRHFKSMHLLPEMRYNELSLVLLFFTSRTSPVLFGNKLSLPDCHVIAIITAYWNWSFCRSCDMT